MNAEAEYADLIARFAASSPIRHRAEDYIAQGYSHATVNDYLRPIVLDIDAFESTLDI
jgi:hypothetical protein